MGDRAVITFADAWMDVAHIYLHWDGSNADDVLSRFFDAEEKVIEAGQRDNRFDDPSYLAARFVAWKSDDRGTGIGIVPAGSAEDRNWRVTCAGKGRPVIAETT